MADAAHAALLVGHPEAEQLEVLLVHVLGGSHRTVFYRTFNGLVLTVAKMMEYLGRSTRFAQILMDLLVEVDLRTAA